MASGDAPQMARPQPEAPRFGMRLWLTGAFAAVSLITAGTVYLVGDNHQALLAAVLIGVLAGFLIAVAISHRVVVLARAAGEMATGSTRSATWRARSTRCGPRCRRASACSPPTATSWRRSSTG
jgi:type IV secretory pathway VirB3-like protein